jgi:hypothetical protein
MPNTTLSPHLALIDEATLTPLVQLALDRPASVVLTWTWEQGVLSIALPGRRATRVKRHPGR